MRCISWTITNGVSVAVRILLESCFGQDNPGTKCIVRDVPNIFAGSESNHLGPYDGVTKAVEFFYLFSWHIMITKF